MPEVAIILYLMGDRGLPYIWSINFIGYDRHYNKLFAPARTPAHPQPRASCESVSAHAQVNTPLRTVDEVGSASRALKVVRLGSGSL